MKADVLVVGAGPAGSAAALVLARRGYDVVLADRAAFPRDKVCGDALIPDALAALATLGVLDRVLPLSRPLHEVRLYPPDGREVRLRGECAVVQRRAFDDLLRTAAIDAGARFLAPYRAIRAVTHGSHHRGAVLRHTAVDETTVVAAPWTILATGAATESLRAFGVCTRPEASGTAARVYIEAPAAIAHGFRHLALCLQKDLAPGYGWVFPAPGNMFNVGVGVFRDGPRRNRTRNLRELMDTFLRSFEPARTVAGAAVACTRLAGAPLRTALHGAVLAGPGLLVAGEAAGTTYSFSGEGIGKALETGMLAGATVADALSGSADPHHASREYAARVETFRERFRAYKTAQDCLAYPFVGNLIARRANAGRFVREQLEGLFSETVNPRALFSVSGIVRGLMS